MMQAGNRGGEKRGGGKKPSEKDQLQFSVCDVSSDDFKRTWLKLKELHDQELQRIQAKLITLRKQQLAGARWMGSAAKIRELTEQQKVLTSTIHDLREKLNAKVCNRCSMNEAYKNTLQQEFYDIQQRNIKFIAELTAERNKLREENKVLSARLKLNQQQSRPSFSESDDDFFPCTQKTRSVFSVREPAQQTQVHLPVRGIKQSHTQQMTSGGQKEQQQSLEFSLPLYSQDIFEVPETSLEETPSNSNKPLTGASASQTSRAGCLLTPTFGSPSGYEFQGVSNLPEERRGQPKRKHASLQKISTPHLTHFDFPWSLSSISTGENITTQVVSETSEENMPDYKRGLFPPFTQSKEKPPLNVFPFDYTLRSNGKRRATVSTAGDNTRCSVRDGSNQTSSNEELASSKNTNECTGAEGGADKPQGDTQSVILRSTIKRKARVQSEKRKI